MKFALLVSILLFAPGSFAQQLGFTRLFSTPTQRADLNEGRQRLIQGLDTPEQVEESEAVQEERLSTATTLQELLLPRAKFNGMIIRSNGRADYWVNGKSTTDKSELGQELKSKPTATVSESL